MQKHELSLALLGAVLSSVVAGSVAHAAQSTAHGSVISPEEYEAAAALADMINRGHIIVDPKTGKLKIRGSITSILKDYSLIQEGNAPIIEAAGCSGTTGGGCLSSDGI